MIQFASTEKKSNFLQILPAGLKSLDKVVEFCPAKIITI